MTSEISIVRRMLALIAVVVLTAQLAMMVALGIASIARQINGEIFEKVEKGCADD